MGSGPAVVVGFGISVTTGSAGVSATGASSSECKPFGSKGRRKVPLLGSGLIPKESHMML